MKGKRIICFIALLFLVIAFSSATVLVYANTSITSTEVNISVMGDISYVKHNVLFPDNVSFNASAYGGDTYMLIYSATDVQAYVKPGTDSVKLGKYTFRYNKLTHSANNLACDKNGTHAELYMHCVDVNGTVYSY